jgi:hypothetical protein
MGQEAAIAAPEFDEALDLAACLAAAADEGRVDLSDLDRRAPRLLASTTASGTGLGNSLAVAAAAGLCRFAAVGLRPSDRAPDMVIARL